MVTNATNLVPIKATGKSTEDSKSSGNGSRIKSFFALKKQGSGE